jgi:diphthamide synthase (EF-2-diphthine--ammonia ligase)
MKQSLKERFQQLAGIKSLYTENDKADRLDKIFTDNYKKPQFKRIQPTGEEGEYYTDFVNFPNSDDSSVGIGDEKAWESWKSKIMGRYGNVTIILKPKSENWFDKVFIDDDSFNQNRYKFLK